jgi:hypothetical protein
MQIQLRPGVGFLRRFTVVDELERELVAELDVEVDDWGGVAITRLEFRGPDVGSANRDYPAMTVARHAAGSARSMFGWPERVGKSRRWRPPGAAERTRIYRELATGGRKPRRGSRISDDQSRSAAEVYKAALKAGDPPTQAVADTFGVGRSTAARWIQIARDRGHLGPATPGKASA